MNPSVFVATYDRPVPVHSSSTTSALINSFDRPVPVHNQAGASCVIMSYDRPTPIYMPQSNGVSATYENITTANPTQLKRWDGTQWVRSPYYVWNGTTWVQIT